MICYGQFTPTTPTRLNSTVGEYRRLLPTAELSPISVVGVNWLLML